MPNSKRETFIQVADVAKDVSEVTVFTFFAKHAWMEMFTASPLHFIFFPVIGASLAAFAANDLYLLKQAEKAKRQAEAEERDSRSSSGSFIDDQDKEVKEGTLFPHDFSGLPNPSVDIDEQIRLLKFKAATSGIAACLANGAIIGSLALGASFTLTPYLFAAAMGVMAIRFLVLSIKSAIDLYHAGTLEEMKTHRQELVKNIVRFVAVSLVVTLVVGAMISPFAPAVLFAVGMAAAGVAFLFMAWKHGPKKIKRAIKSFHWQKNEGCCCSTPSLKQNGSGFFGKARYGKVLDDAPKDRPGLGANGGTVPPL